MESNWWVSEPEDVSSHPYYRLVQAIHAGDMSTVASLLNNKPLLHPSRPLPASLNPLIVEACLSRQYDILDYLLSHNPEALYAVDTERQASLLHLSALQGDTGIAELLLTYNNKHSSNIDNSNARLLHSLDIEGFNPLHYAANYGQKAVSSLLLRAGADINAQGGPLNMTPLLLAASAGHAHCVEYLLSQRANLNAVDSAFKRTALHWAVDAGSEQAVKMILYDDLSSGKGSEIINAQDTELETPLFLASRRGMRPIVDLLLGRNAATEVVNRFQISPLMVASFFGHRGVVESLLHAGSNVTAREPVHQRTAVHLAALGGHPDVMEMLLSSSSAPGGAETLEEQLREGEAQGRARFDDIRALMTEDDEEVLAALQRF